MKELKQLREKLIKKYGNDINDLCVRRMWNTATLRWLIKYKYIELFSSYLLTNKKEFVLMNNLNEAIRIEYSGEFKITLYLGEENIADITSLVMNKNKYGSAIFKRFFKYYDDLVLNHLFNISEIRNMMNNDWIETCIKKGYNRIYTNFLGERLKIIDGKAYLETKDMSGKIIIINNPDEALISKFNKYLYISDRYKTTN